MQEMTGGCDEGLVVNAMGIDNQCIVHFCRRFEFFHCPVTLWSDEQINPKGVSLLTLLSTKAKAAFKDAQSDSCKGNSTSVLTWVFRYSSPSLQNVHVYTFHCFSLLRCMIYCAFIYSRTHIHM